MRMIIGGACQGKLDYAKSRFPGLQWEDGRTCRLQAVYTCEGMYHFESYIQRMMREMQEKTEEICREITESNPGIVIVTNEIGYGLVPADAFERRYREMTGRICTALAAQSEEVVRVVCGIGTRLR